MVHRRKACGAADMRGGAAVVRVLRSDPRAASKIEADEASDEQHPRRDSNPRFRAENPASQPLDHGGMRSARKSEVLESNQALLGISEPCRHGHRPPKLRRQGSNLLFAINSRASYPFDHAGSCSGRRGSRTPNGRSRTRFRDGIPHRWQSFRVKWPRQESNLHRAE